MKQEYKKLGQRFIVLIVLLMVLGLSASAGRCEEDFRSAVQTARASGVSEEVISRVLVVGYHYNLESKDLVGFLTVATEAGKRQLPVDPLVGKIEEGLAKGVETPRIQQVLRHDLAQYGFVQELLQKTVFAKGLEPENVRTGDVVRLARALSMGIAQNEMQSLLHDTPRVSMGEIVNAVEFTAALKQAGQDFAEAKEITMMGLQSGFFTRTAWNLPLMISTAKSNQLSDDQIKAAALEVVKGNKTVLEAHTALGLDPKGLARGPVVSAPSSVGAGAGKGQTGGAGQGGQGSGAAGIGGGSGGGGGGGGGAGAGGPGAGGGGGGAGAGGPGGGGGGSGR